MPYSRFFSGGQAFHGVYGSLRTTVGSMGCVNLTVGDARRLWGVLKKGDRVFVRGRRPGTQPTCWRGRCRRGVGPL